MDLATAQQHLENFLRSLPIDRELLPPETCLVGGAVRDALLERQGDYLDFDFVVPDKAIAIASDIAKQYKAGFVVLDPERFIARVVFPEGTLDFAQQEGDSLEIDLHRRDYRINAIAYHLQSQTFIDPLDGLIDLGQGLLRMVAPQNLEDDPLRLLRAYRQAAQLGFEIEAETQAKLREYAPLITKVAAERVQQEFNYLLACQEGDRWITLAYKDDVLTHWLPHAHPEKIARLQKIPEIWQDLSNQFPAFADNSQWLYLSKLSILAGINVTQAQETLLNLKYSRQELRAVTLVVEILPELMAIAHQPFSLRQQYLFFNKTKDYFPVITILALTHKLSLSQLEPLLKRFFDPTDPVAHPQLLLTGKDLIQELQISPGPNIGTLLTEIQIAQIEGQISTKKEAINWGRSYLQTLPKNSSWKIS